MSFTIGLLASSLPAFLIAIHGIRKQGPEDVYVSIIIGWPILFACAVWQSLS